VTLGVRSMGTFRTGRIIVAAAFLSTVWAYAGDGYGPVDFSFGPGHTGTIKVSDDGGVFIATVKSRFESNDDPNLAWTEGTQEIELRIDKNSTPIGFQMVVTGRQDNAPAIYEFLRCKMRGSWLQQAPTSSTAVHGPITAADLKIDFRRLFTMSSIDTRPAFLLCLNFFRNWSAFLKTPEGERLYADHLEMANQDVPPKIQVLSTIASKITPRAITVLADFSAQLISLALTSRRRAAGQSDRYKFETAIEGGSPFAELLGDAANLGLVRFSSFGLKNFRWSIGEEGTGRISPSTYKTCVAVLALFNERGRNP
jgi:hypothetical protein